HLQTTTTASGDIALRLTTGSEPILPIGGSVQSMLDFMNHDLGDVQGRLDAVASGLVQKVNTLHAAGVTYATGSATPTAAGAFFDPTKTSARDIHLDAAVAANAANIATAAAVPSGTNVAGPGNNEVALALASLR